MAPQFPLLFRHHEALEAACLALLGQVYADDPHALVATWREIEAELIDHMSVEESTMLPRFAAANPEAAATIREQHARLLELMNRVGLEVQLRGLRAESMQSLVTALRAHAVYESLTLYCWAEKALPVREREALCAQLGN